MQFGYPYLIRLSFFEIQSDPGPVLNYRIRLDRDPETGSCSTLILWGPCAYYSARANFTGCCRLQCVTVININYQQSLLNCKNIRKRVETGE